MSVTISGDGTLTGISVGGLPDGIVDTDMLAANAVSSAKLAAGAGGKILQVVSTTKSDAFSGTSNQSELTITGLNASITPSSTNSKILILVQIHYGCNGTTYGMYLKRGSTKIGIGDASSNRQQVTGGLGYTIDGNQTHTFPMSYLDSPATTSSVTYSVHAINDNSVALYVNRSLSDSNGAAGKRGISTITLMEIG